MIRLTLRKTLMTGGVALALGVAAGCGTDDGAEEAVVPETTGSSAAASASAPAAALPTAACPLVDTELLPTLFQVSAPRVQEKDPVRGAGSVTTYSCDVSDGGELFLTVGTSVGPQSGSAEANVRAALEGAAGEPVSGVGEAAAFGAKDGVGTVAGVKAVGGKYVLVFVHGAADDKEQLVKVARSAASRV
jgi:hypothetical protein